MMALVYGLMYIWDKCNDSEIVRRWTKSVRYLGG